MIFDGTIKSFDEIRKVHPSAKVYAMQRILAKPEISAWDGDAYPAGSVIFDPFQGQPMLVIEDRKNNENTDGWLFEIGADVS